LLHHKQHRKSNRHDSEHDLNMGSQPDHRIASVTARKTTRKIKLLPTVVAVTLDIPRPSPLQHDPLPGRRKPVFVMSTKTWLAVEVTSPCLLPLEFLADNAISRLFGMQQAR
jgi:hypothetical protein